MIVSGLSVPVPVVDNRRALHRLEHEIARERRIARRASDFASSPIARSDRTIQDRVLDLLLVSEEHRYTLSDIMDELHDEQGGPAPTQETWEALTDDERQMLLEDYLEHDCRTGQWEFNPWGPVIERNNPLAFQPRRYGLSIDGTTH